MSKLVDIEHTFMGDNKYIRFVDETQYRVFFVYYLLADIDAPDMRLWPILIFLFMLQDYLAVFLSPSLCTSLNRISSMALTWSLKMVGAGNQGYMVYPREMENLKSSINLMPHFSASHQNKLIIWTHNFGCCLKYRMKPSWTLVCILLAMSRRACLCVCVCMCVEWGDTISQSDSNLQM